MGLDELKWERQSSLKDMMDHYNALVDEMEQMSHDMSMLAKAVDVQHSEMSEKFHALDDKILTVNYKTDEMKRDITDKLDDILKRINRIHPGS